MYLYTLFKKRYTKFLHQFSPFSNKKFHNWATLFLIHSQSSRNSKREYMKRFATVSRRDKIRSERVKTHGVRTCAQPSSQVELVFGSYATMMLTNVLRSAEGDWRIVRQRSQRWSTLGAASIDRF